MVLPLFRFNARTVRAGSGEPATTGARTWPSLETELNFVVMLPGTGVIRHDTSVGMNSTLGSGDIHKLSANAQYLTASEHSRTVKNEPSSGCQEIVNVQKDMHNSPSSSTRAEHPVNLFDKCGEKSTRVSCNASDLEIPLLSLIFNELAYR